MRMTLLKTSHAGLACSLGKISGAGVWCGRIVPLMARQLHNRALRALAVALAAGATFSLAGACNDTGQDDGQQQEQEQQQNQQPGQQQEDD